MADKGALFEEVLRGEREKKKTLVSERWEVPGLPDVVSQILFKQIQH